MKNNVSHQGRAAVQCFGVLCLILAYAPISAQEAPKTEDPGPSAVEAKQSDDNVVQLSHFEVTTTQDKGYVTTNAATGFKTNQPLLSIPQAITVVTRDLIEDIGYAQSSDALQFAGGVPGGAHRGNHVESGEEGAPVAFAAAADDEDGGEGLGIRGKG
jgi:outer membrane receptor for monomeric catechols